jgi:uncharacterized repeat protein (TIGR03803 family)
MTKLTALKTTCAVIFFCTVTAISAHSQAFTVTFTNLANFGGRNGYEPFYVSIVQGADGNLYGTTAYGGDADFACVYDYPDCGTIFRITPGDSVTTIYSFCSGNDCIGGGIPYAGLIQATDGNLYGTVSGASDGGGGAVFKMSLGSEVSLIYTFGLEGYEPLAPLVQGSDGNFYGTTYTGGTLPCSQYEYGCGTVFKITPSGVLTTLHSFNGADGEGPIAGLVQATDGSLYGTTVGGGNSTCYPSANGCGTIFKITSTGSFATLYNFQGNDGSRPYGALVQGSDGNLYGTTTGTGYGSTVFKISLSGTLTTLYSPFSDDDGAPLGTLIQATDGNFYGTTEGGGQRCPPSCGTIFQITPAGLLTKLYTFDGSDGNTPYGGLVQATDGSFYGTTAYGGTAGDGSVFHISIDLAPFVAFVRNPAQVGQTFGILGYGLTGTTSVSLNGTPATFTIKSDTLLEATVPAGATTGYVTVTTPSGTLTSNVPFHVIP